jgi:cyclopropane-fatty-acyl-phospholipid synthase
MPESRYDAYCNKTDFIQKHIFPGGHCPSMTAITNAVQRGTNGQLMLDEVVNIGPHYSKALRIWREKFIANYERVSANSPYIYNDEFKRRFEFYFAYCEIGFATRTLGVHQIRFTRCQNYSLLQGIPLE